mgnify:CR=1 FL=1
MFGNSDGIKILGSTRKNRIYTVTYSLGTVGVFDAHFFVGALGPICNHVAREDGSIVDTLSGIDYRHYDAFLHVFDTDGKRNNSAYVG